jgi:hypothetical protein
VSEIPARLVIGACAIGDMNPSFTFTRAVSVTRS